MRDDEDGCIYVRYGFVRRMLKKLQNTLTEYFFRKGYHRGWQRNLRMNMILTVIMIRQGKEPEENGIFEYLNGIFDGDINRIQNIHI